MRRPRRIPLLGFSLVLADTAMAPFYGQQRTGNWPTVDEQLQNDPVTSGSALAALIIGNQNFDMLRPDEANGEVGLSPWLRVSWRKRHREAVYSANDPTGGYPRVAHEVHEWMKHHQDSEARA